VGERGKAPLFQTGSPAAAAKVRRKFFAIRLEGRVICSAPGTGNHIRILYTITYILILPETGLGKRMTVNNILDK